MREEIDVIIKSIDYESGRVYASIRELLGTWEENAVMFSPGETVAGIVRSIEDYGVFVELAPNLAGLAEPKEDLKVGQKVSVYIKNLLPDKMKVKLIIIDTFTSENYQTKLQYFCNEDHIDSWQYSPDCCKRKIYSEF